MAVASPAPLRVGRRLLVALGAGVAASVTAGVATTRALDLLGSFGPSTTAAVIIAEVYLCVLLALLAVFAASGDGRERVLALRRPSARALSLGAALWLGAYVAAGVLYLAAGALGFRSDAVVKILLGVGADGGRLAGASAALTVLILLRVCVLVPLAEELLFRGALYTWLRNRLSPAWTIAITATAFGVMHQMPAFIPLAVVVGVAAGWIREKTGSTVVPILMHAVQNVAVVLASLLVTGWEATLPLG